MAVQVLRRTFTVDEYHQMIEAGVLTEDDRVELLEGEIVGMTPIGSPHAACVKRLNHFFSDRVGNRALVSVQDPIQISEHSEPEPDAALLRPHPDFYAESHPKPEDVLLVVEVAESSVEYDRDRKIPAYGRAGIAEAWLVDLAGEVIEAYSDPSAHGYRKIRRLWRSDSLAPQVFPDLKVAVDDVLG
ncbi:MAG: hypothetical protein MAG451_00949 [Anaerolineales bacterium]|nr:hypothetical protein [Anaerolineales bacterium]